MTASDDDVVVDDDESRAVDGRAGDIATGPARLIIEDNDAAVPSGLTLSVRQPRPRGDPKSG